MRRLVGALALLGLGVGSISLLSCGQAAPAPRVNAGGSIAAGAGGAGSGGVVVPELGTGGYVNEGPQGDCHPNTTSRRGEDIIFCDWVASCDGVSCVYGPTDTVSVLPPVLACRQGYEVGLPAGACCYDCTRTQEPLDPVTCVEACPDKPPSCQAGYHAAARPDGCCLECVVDQDYCNSDVDCVLAKRPANCCACVEAVSVRRLDADDCYSNVSPARTTPDSCPPDNDCELVDCGCPAEIPTSAACVDHHCSPG